MKWPATSGAGRRISNSCRSLRPPRGVNGGLGQASLRDAVLSLPEHRQPYFGSRSALGALHFSLRQILLFVTQIVSRIPQDRFLILVIQFAPKLSWRAHPQ